MTTLPDNLGPQGDDIYAALMDAHDGLTEAQSHALNARLVLLMTNEIGALETLRTLIAAAKNA